MEDITAKRYVDGKPILRCFHQARWNEPIIFELSTEGERGLLVPEVDPQMRADIGDPLSEIPQEMRRQASPRLPEVSQPQVLRHYLRLSQENLGADLNVDIYGTCTMKYSPKINDQVVRTPGVSELHPLQPEETVQGMLGILYGFEQVLKAVSGLDRFSLQPRSGSAGIYANMAMLRAYHESRGEGAQRREIITTIFSHPSDAACAHLVGFDIVTLPPGPDGYPELTELTSALSDRTAGLMITNPEDTGIFNPGIADFTRAVHAAGGLCCYDQANANGILGIARAREAGFDLCQFNLHKTFSVPHACGGPGAGAIGVREDLAKFLPTPLVEFDGCRYYMDWNRPDSIGKVAYFYGCASNVVRAYAWAMSLGAEGLREVAEIAVLNNNYLMKKLLQLRGVCAPFAPGRPRIEQVRYSWEELAQDTGITTQELGLRAADFGVHYWTSHRPFVVPSPCTLEPTESYSQRELDEYASIMEHVVHEAYTNPEIVKTAPHNSSIHRVNQEPLRDPLQRAMTWRAYRRKVEQTSTCVLDEDGVLVRRS